MSNYKKIGIGTEKLLTTNEEELLKKFCILSIKIKTIFSIIFSVN